MPRALLLILCLAMPALGRSAEPDRFRLDNGMRVILRPIVLARQTALVVLYDIGGDHDPAGRSGLAHLVEHLYVTAKAGDAPSRTAEQYFRSYPSGCNAQTGDRFTVIATVFPKDDFERELRDAAARMSALEITAEDLKREKPRVMDELANMFERMPNLAALNNARELVRPTPNGGRKGGRVEHVRAASLDEVQDRWRRYYKPRNAVLVVAGAIDGEKARAAIAREFAGIAPGDPLPPPNERGAAPEKRTLEVVVDGLAPHSPPVSAVAFAAPSPESELYAPHLALGARLISAGARLDDDAGRASVYMPIFDDPEILAVSSSARPGETIEAASDRLTAFIDEAVKPGLQPNEARAVGSLFGIQLGTAEPWEPLLAANPYGVAFALGRREQLGINPGKLKADLESLTADQVKQAASEIFSPKHRAFVRVAPTGDRLDGELPTGTEGAAFPR